MTTLFQYPSCSTCRTAKKWLEAANLEVTSVHIVDDPPGVEKLQKLHAASGLPLKKFFNTSGQSYRNGGFKERLKSMTESEMLQALASDGKLIKRPILESGTAVLVGFREAEYDQLFNGK